MRNLKETQRLLEEMRHQISGLRGRMSGNAAVLGEWRNDKETEKEFKQADADLKEIFNKSMEVFD